jgi:hypothetical protein
MAHARERKGYARKVELGLVPYVYQKESASFRAGVVVPGIAKPRGPCAPRPGRHCFTL